MDTQFSCRFLIRNADGKMGLGIIHADYWVTWCGIREIAVRVEIILVRLVGPWDRWCQL